MPFESRFGQAADIYSTFRPEYPPALYNRILAELPPGRRERAMDLGAGTGICTRALAEYFAEVIAVEPDPLMAQRIREAAPRAIVRVTTAEECEQAAASVDLVNVATALHWMDVSRVISNVEHWLRPGGVLAAYAGGFPPTPEPVQAIIQQEFAQRWDKFRDNRLKRKEFPQSIVRAAKGLHVGEEVTVPFLLPLTPLEFTGFCRSTSYGSAYGRTLADQEAYWRELEERFSHAWPGQKIPVDFSLWLILAHRE